MKNDHLDPQADELFKRVRRYTRHVRGLDAAAIAQIERTMPNDGRAGDLFINALAADRHLLFPSLIALDARTPSELREWFVGRSSGRDPAGDARSAPGDAANEKGVS